MLSIDNNTKMNIGFIGLGKLGMPCAEKISEKYQVYGYDVVKRFSNKIKIENSIPSVIKNSDIILVAVPTPHAPQYDGSHPTTNLPVKDFDYSIVISVLDEICSCNTKNKIICLVSTVLPGTCRREFKDYIDQLNFVYNPYLIAMGSEAYDMVHPDMVILGSENGESDQHVRTVEKFYRSIIENNAPFHVGTWEECEAFKIFYNTLISARLGLVNMIQDVAERVGNMNVEKVTDALKNCEIRITGPRYYTAGMGDGGACHPRDNIALSSMAKRLQLGYDLFHAISDAREKQTQNMAMRISEIAKDTQLDIIINGKAYKPGVPYTIGSPSLLLAHYLEELGHTVKFADPETGDVIEDKTKGLIVTAHAPAITYGHTGKQLENNLYFEPHKDSVIFDVWRNYTGPLKSVRYGNTRKD